MGFFPFLSGKHNLLACYPHGKAKMKFAIDVALSGAFGVDLALDNATPEEREQIAEGVRFIKAPSVTW